MPGIHHPRRQLRDYNWEETNSFCILLAGLAEHKAGKQEDFGLIPLRLFSLQKGCGLWTLSCDFVLHLVERSFTSTEIIGLLGTGSPGWPPL